jgi:WD40 repeat protein
MIGVCPYCQAKNKDGKVLCSNCGKPLAGVSRPSGTLISDDLPAGVERSSRPGDDFPSGTLDVSAIQSSSGGELSGSDLKSWPQAEEDRQGTIQYPDGYLKSKRLPESVENTGSGTLIKAPDSAVGPHGLDQILREAVGSSGKEAGQSLRHARAEASESVFERISSRHIAPAGQKIDSKGGHVDYQILDKVGEGGMGIVYSANQVAFNRTVALKTIRPERQNDPTLRKQFFYEAEITADLDHPNIPSIYELGTTDGGMLFYSMKLIQGTPWLKLFGNRNREENLEVFRRLCDAVAFAHSRQILHRDIKPENVMIGAYGEVYVVDWGIGVRLESGQFFFAGTPEYMAPEMARNQGSRVGKASDIYLLGATLFQMLTGLLPHPGRTQKERLQAAAENRLAATLVEDPLMDVARRAMSTQPEDRYASVEQMQQAIDGVLRNQESIRLSERAESTLADARAMKDYELFNRSLFGFRESIELWDGNRQAREGLQKARVEFARCALDKQDYDLVIQTADADDREGKELIGRAQVAKRRAASRDARFRWLSRAFVATLLGSTAAIGWSAYKLSDSLLKEEKAKDDALTAKKLADQNFSLAVDTTMDAISASITAEEERQKADQKENEAQTAFEQSIGYLQSSLESEEKATRDRERAESKETEARIARDEAIQKAAQVQIVNSVASQSLAKFQLDQSNVQEATRQLTSALNPSKEGFADGLVPNLETWASRRLNLLSNQDLARQKVPSISTAAVSADGSTAIVGTRDGKVRWLSVENRTLQLKDSAFDLEQGSISAATISPKGEEAVLAVREGGKSGLYAWKATEPQPQRVSFTGSEEFERIAYSPDGLRIAAGISKGLSVWNAREGWYQSASDQAVLEVRIPSIRGELTDLQWIDNSTLLALARFDGKPILHRIDLQQAKTLSDPSKLVTQLSLPSPLDQQLSAATFVGSGTLWILGSEDGSLRTGQLLPAGSGNAPARIGSLFLLPRRHRTAIKSLTSSGDGRVISVGSGEPSVHLWKSDPSGQITYDGSLYGVAGKEDSADQNLGIAQFVAGEVAMGIDNRGEVFLWDVRSQKRRQRLDRGTSESESLYPSPVIGLHELKDGRRVVAVCEDGMTDLWNLVDGRSVPLESGERWSYFGHSPGSQLVDMAVDPQAGVVVTAAIMNQVPGPYNPSKDTQEFVVWDRKTGNMRSRWSEASNTLPRITLLDRGTKLLIATEGKTRVVRLDGIAELPWSSDNLESFFAVAHPTNPERFAMVRKRGKVYLWDRSQGFPETVGANQSSSNADAIQGCWSLDGNFFFLVDSNGYLSKYQAGTGEGGMDLVKQKLFNQMVPISKAENAHRLAPTSARDVDLAIDRSTGDLHIAARTQGRGSLYAVIAPDFETVREVKFSKDLAWLEEGESGTPTLANSIHPKFSFQQQTRDPIAIRKQVGKLVYVATQSGRVMELESDSTSISTYGRRKVIDIAGDCQNDSVLLLLSGGAIWKLSVDAQSQGVWSKLGYELPETTSIELSPNGKELAIFDQAGKTLKLVDPDAGNVRREWAEVAAFAWDPKAGSTLAVCQTSGDAKIFADGKESAVTQRLNLSGRAIQSLHFFRERFLAPQNQVREYLMIQSEQDGKSILSFLPLGEKEIEGQKVAELFEVDDLPSGVLIEPSKDESLLAIGDTTGTLSFEYIAPSFRVHARVFDLEGHLGGAIRTLQFTQNGQTLMSSDSQRRLFGWLSSAEMAALQ